MTVLLESPYPFAERLLLFGGGGAGKTNSCLSIIRRVAHGHMHVIENDYSMAYMRAIATDFPEVEDRVTVYPADQDWQEWADTLAEAIGNADPEVDWVVADPVSPSWDAVQTWYLETVYGDDLPAYLVGLKREFKDDTKGYQAALLDNMNWSVVKKEYYARVYKPIQRWKGHLILTAEAKEISYFDRDDNEIKQLFGPLGFKPSGESRLRHVCSSTLFLAHPKRNEWTMTSVKDRNRKEQDRLPIDDFATDYLMGVAGWEIVRKGR